jgi:alanine racemase
MAAPIYDSSARAWVDVDLAALVRNARWLAARARVPLLPMVKADGYGLGAVAVVNALRGDAGLRIAAFGVAAIAEGAALREAGLSHDVVCFSPIWGDDLRAAREVRIVPSFGDPDDVLAWSNAGGGPWQLSIDTGMNRAGASSETLRQQEPRLRALRERCLSTPPAGVWTHFHSADEDRASIHEQERRFEEIVAALGVPETAVRHCDNSAGILAREGSPWGCVRPGVALYGVSQGMTASLEPVAQLRARVVDIRDVHVGASVSYGATWRASRPSRIATVAVGYADGYRRHLGNRGVALLNGHRVPVVGRVTMDLTMLDVTGVPVSRGDVATLLGRDGELLLTADEVAASADLSPYELLTGLHARPPRRWASVEAA